MRHGGPVGHHAAKPAVVDVILAAVACCLGDLVSRRTLGADEQDTAATRCDIAQRFQRGVQHRHGLLQVENVDLVPLAENERLHAGIPATGAVAEMDAGFQHLAHGKGWQRHRVTPVLRLSLHAGNERCCHLHRKGPLPAAAGGRQPACVNCAWCNQSPAEMQAEKPGRPQDMSRVPVPRGCPESGAWNGVPRRSA